ERNARDRANAVLTVVVREQDRRRAYHDRRVANARWAGERDGEEEAHTAMTKAAPKEDLDLIRDRVADLVCDLRWDLEVHEEESITNALIECVSDVLGAKHLRIAELQDLLNPNKEDPDV